MHINQYKEKVIETIIEPMLSFMEYWDDDDEFDYTLIETEARESIWDIIQTSAIDCGLQEYEDDITEEWREW